MKRFQNTISKNTQFKGVLVVILLLSLFTFSGNNTYPTHQQVTKTELVTVARASNNAFSININKCIVGQKKHKSSSPLSKFDISTTLRLYAQYVATKFEKASGMLLTGQQSLVIFRPQNIPHRSDEDDLHFLRG